MKKTTLILLFLFIASCLNVKAEVVKVDGIFYSLNGNEATVMPCQEGEKGLLYRYNASSYTIPAEITVDGLTYKVTTISDDAFFSSTTYNIDLPEGLKTIGLSFYYCENLTYIVIPNSVEVIEDGAFANCPALMEINVDEGNTHYSSIGGFLYNKTQTKLIQAVGAFSGSYTIPNSVTTIGESAFSGCRGLTSVTIPNSVTTIGKSAFSGCSGLTSVTIPNSVTTIGRETFQKCSGLTSVTIPNSVTTIGMGAFFGCSNLTDIVIPNSVEVIEDRVFQRCVHLTSIVMSSSINTIPISMGGIPFFGYYNNTEYSLEEIIYTSPRPPVNWLAAPLTYVPCKENYSHPPYQTDESSTINIKEMITWKGGNLFAYNGQTPYITFQNNMEGYTATMDRSALKKDIGTWSLSIPFTFTNTTTGKTFDALIPLNYTIARKVLHVSVKDATRTYGETNPDFSLTYNGFSAGDDESIFTTPVVATTTATPNSPAGEYPITLSGGVAKDYNITYQPGVLTVTKAPLTAKVANATRKYGSDNPHFDVEYSGLKNNETILEWITAPSISTQATKESNIGDYLIHYSDGEARNYELTAVTQGKLTITPADLTITAVGGSRLYFEDNPEFSLRYSGFVNGEDASVLEQQAVISCEATKDSNAGTYDVLVSGGKAQNYRVSHASGKLEILKRTLFATIPNYERVYAEDNPEIALDLSGFVNSEDESVIDALPVVKHSAQKMSSAGTYDITLEGGNDNNYDFAYEPGTLTIKPAELTISVTGGRRLYFEDNPEFPLHYSGFVNEEDASVLEKLPAIICTATKESDAGTYDVSVSGARGKNYNINYVSDKLEILKRTLTISTPNYERVYNEENPKIELAFSGFVNAEDETFINDLPTAIHSAKKDSDVGIYDIKLYGGEDNNYDFAYEPGTLSIKKADQSITWDQDFTQLFIGDQVRLTATASSGLPVEYIIPENEIVSTYYAGETLVLDCIAEGELWIRASQPGNNNYNSSERPAREVIIKDRNANRIDYQKQGTCTVEVRNGAIILKDDNYQTVFDIYTPQGRRIYSGKSGEINVVSGLYIVKYNEQSKKVLVD